MYISIYGIIYEKDKSTIIAKDFPETNKTFRKNNTFQKVSTCFLLISWGINNRITRISQYIWKWINKILN